MAYSQDSNHSYKVFRFYKLLLVIHSQICTSHLSLHCLILEENASKKKKAILWDSECEKVFSKPKEMCTSIPTLVYGNFFKPFKLHTYVCILRLGAILYQNQDRVDWVIGYASRALSKAKCRYPVPRLEFLALKWVIMEQFHEYLIVTLLSYTQTIIHLHIYLN